jgi:hypothetical protein
MELIAYQIHDVPEFVIEPAPSTRAWMDATDNRFAYRCLPLVMANQMGWIVRCAATFEVYWNGENSPGEGLVFNWAPETAHLSSYIQDHFGSGILTFSLPFLFRTSPDYGLIVRVRLDRSDIHDELENCRALSRDALRQGLPHLYVAAVSQTPARAGGNPHGAVGC